MNNVTGWGDHLGVPDDTLQSAQCDMDEVKAKPSHTPEPWYARPNGIWTHPEGGVNNVVVFDFEVSDSDMKRVCLCVNACAGMKDPEKEIARLRKENDTLRGLLGNSALPCVYCGLPANEQGKCESGFPGCARADDQQLSHLFAIEYDNECMRKELAKLLADKQVLVDALESLAGLQSDWSPQSKIIREAIAKVKEST